MSLYPLISGAAPFGSLAGGLCHSSYPALFSKLFGTALPAGTALRRFTGDGDFSGADIDPAWQMFDFLLLILGAGLFLCFVVLVIAALKRRQRQRLQDPRKDHYHKQERVGTPRRRGSSSSSGRTGR